MRRFYLRQLPRGRPRTPMAPGSRIEAHGASEDDVFRPSFLVRQRLVNLLHHLSGDVASLAFKHNPSNIQHLPRKIDGFLISPETV